MLLESSFDLPVEPVEVWPKLFDPDAMRFCLPGCEELVQVDETTYQGRLVNQVAKVKFNAAFSVNVVETSKPERVVMVLNGEDNRLASTIKVNAQMSLSPNAGGSRVDYRMELSVWGRLGRMGEPIIRRRTAEVEREFAVRLAQVCGSEQPAGSAATPAPQPAPRPVPAAADGRPGLHPLLRSVLRLVRRLLLLLRSGTSRALAKLDDLDA